MQATDRHGTTFTARTTRTPAGFLSIITRRKGGTETLVGRELYPTRGRAYRSAVAVVKARTA